MKKFIQIKHSMVAFGVAIALSFGVSNTVFAHVTVKPSEAPTATYELFTVSVPNEKTQPTTALRLIVPEGVTNITPSQKEGWSITTIEKSGAATEIIWSDGIIAAERRDDFTFSAQTPVESTTLQWKAYQTYADGTVVAWDKDASETEHSETNSGPFSVTNITDDSTEAQDDDTDTAGRAAAQVALFAAGTAVAVALLAVFIATRKK